MNTQMIKPFFLTIVHYLFFITPSSAQDTMPVKWQHGMKLLLTYSGGMSPYYLKAEITDTGSYITETIKNKLTRYKVEIPNDQLDELLHYLHQHQFHKLKAKMTGPVSDKGSESILITWNGGSAGAGENYMMGYEGKDRELYSMLRHHIYSLIVAHRTKKQPLQLTETL